MTGAWDEVDKVVEYLARADTLPHRGEGEGVLVRDLAGVLPGRVLDLGCGDGRLTALVLAAYPDSVVTCVEKSPPMLDDARGAPRRRRPRHRRRPRLRRRAPFERRVVRRGRLVARPPPPIDERKQSLFAEIAALLAPGGGFANLDIVRSPTQALHDRWRDEMGARDDPSDVLTDLSTQLDWMRATGLAHVDCIWKWRSLALMRGERPA